MASRRLFDGAQTELGILPIVGVSGSAITGAGSGDFGLTGAASGTVGSSSGVTGTATGALGLTGSAVASVRISAASSGTIALAGSSSVVVRAAAAASGSISLTGAAAAAVRITGSSVGELSLTGTANGAIGNVPVTGAASGALGLTGSSAGTVRISAATIEEGSAVSTTTQTPVFVADGGIITFAYPSGRAAGDYLPGGHVLTLSGTSWFTPDEIAVTLGASDISVVYMGGEVIPKGSVLTLLLSRATASSGGGGAGGGYGGLSILDYATEAELAIDPTAALQSAALSGLRVIVPNLGFDYAITSFLDFANGTEFVGIDRPVITPTTAARIFRANTGVGGGIEGFILDGNKGVVPAGSTILWQGAVGFKMRDCLVRNARGALAMTNGAARNRIEDCDFEDGAGTAVEINGSGVTDNEVMDCRFLDNVGFGVWIHSGANRNKVHGVSCSSNGLELVGITYNSWGNRVSVCHAEGCGDNGFSITGYNNVVTGCTAQGNDYHGICVYGKFNTIVGNEAWNNGQADNGNLYGGITLVGESGGIAQHNVITGNFCDDDQPAPTQAYGIKINAAAYNVWAATTAYVVGNYAVSDNKLYHCTVAGTSSGSGPTHTSGTATDGTVTWAYYDTFFGGTREPYGNTVGPNKVVRFGTAAYLDGTTNKSNNIYQDSGVRFYGSGSDSYFAGSLRRRATAWGSGQSVAYGDVRYNVNNHYRCVNAGGTTANAPTHGSGSSTGADGIAWWFAGSGQDAALLVTADARSVVHGSIGIQGMDTATTVRCFAGTGSPESKVAAPIGSIYLRTDGSTSTTLYVKTADAALATGWTAK